MSSCVTQNSKHTNDISLDVIKEQYEIMLSEVMEQFNLTIQRKQEDIEKLDHIRHSADQIRPFSDEIASIASNTRLISINALIEAARAGQHGKTFAVVASEVRQLADKSRMSAEEMEKSLNEIVAFIEHSIAELQNAIDVESSFIKSTMVLIQDVVMSVVDSFIAISEAIEKTIGDSSSFRNEVNHIVVNLQFEDICRQMAQHTVDILDVVRNDLNILVSGEDMKRAQESKEQQLDASMPARNNICLAVNALFTMEEERELARKSLGINSLDDSLSDKDISPEDNDDVTFFDDQEADSDMDSQTDKSVENDKDAKNNIEFDDDDDVTFF
ncbi:MAG: hypothetical protein HQK62_13830 [Desulfamplus sp.]|nr:hypothetical protein [Desulfamplus sp.]